ncbi:PPE family protein [Mycobacterium sp. M1]|uniref:PPE family protein n=1 Tax=Mycolicibacter acidiphilus TaxID=2835306 RepID=A0ABS5RPN7_9MYCO|nr:PPE family protein [Mycolicibacter acidiphilus]MBS9536252.1 PPE family protein [Mycolicibacter acidiphilus]
MIDYAVLPPEVNSARMYAGAGATPMLTAAAVWDRLSATLTSTAGSYRAVLAELTDGHWQGSSAAAMAAAAEPYSAWMTNTAAQAAQTATQARAAAASYEAAFAATVPPPVIAANRAELLNLVSSNIFGQNSAAIAMNHADYSEMWAQDAAAMHAYAENSAAAAPNSSALAVAPRTTNPAGVGSQASAAAQAAATGMAADSNPLLDFLTSPLVQGFEQFTHELTPFMSFIQSLGLDSIGTEFGSMLLPTAGATLANYVWTALNPWAVGLASSVSGGGSNVDLAGSTVSEGGYAALASRSSEVSASLGRAASFGGLSVPQAWGAPPQGIRPTAVSLPMTGAAGLPEAAMGSIGAIPPIGSVVNAPKGGGAATRTGVASAAAAGTTTTAGGGEDRVATAADTEDVQRQRDELNNLRWKVIEMRVRRDTLRRSAASVIRRVKSGNV